jgi:hypothetical protein
MLEPTEIPALLKLNAPIARWCSRCMESQQCQYQRPNSQRMFCHDCAQVLERSRFNHLNKTGGTADFRAVDLTELEPAAAPEPPPKLPPKPPPRKYKPVPELLATHQDRSPAPLLDRPVNLGELQDWICTILRASSLPSTDIKKRLLYNYGLDISLGALRSHLEILQLQRRIGSNQKFYYSIQKVKP